MNNFVQSHHALSQSNDIQPSLQTNPIVIKNVEQLCDWICDVIDDVKARDIVVLDVREKSSITEMMIIATGTSNRHISSMADQLSQRAKQTNIETYCCAGKDAADWVVIDFGDIIVHLMQQEARDLYALEKLWS